VGGKVAVGVKVADGARVSTTVGGSEVLDGTTVGGSGVWVGGKVAVAGSDVCVGGKVLVATMPRSVGEAAALGCVAVGGKVLVEVLVGWGVGGVVASEVGVVCPGVPLSTAKEASST
jgi:hypothetical protein